MRVDIVPFSARYDLIEGPAVETWNEQTAVASKELYSKLARRYGTPLTAYIGGLHYVLDYQRGGIPTGTVAVPKTKHEATDPENLLIQT